MNQEQVKALLTEIHTLPLSLYNNELNFECKKCGCMVSKRMKKYFAIGFCPDCYSEVNNDN